MMDKKEEFIESLRKAKELLYKNRLPLFSDRIVMGKIPDMINEMRRIQNFAPVNIEEFALFPHDFYCYDPFRNIFYAGSIYAIIFETEKDFNKAVDQCIDFAIRKVRASIEKR